MKKLNGAIRMVRGEEVKQIIPAGQIRVADNGTLWTKGGLPLLGITDPKEKTRVTALIKARKFNEIPAEYFIRLGENPNGVWAGDNDMWETHPAREAEARQAQERAERERRTRRIYLSSRGWGDYSPVEWVGDITRPEGEILAECQRLLAEGYDVDQPNQADDELLAKIKAEKTRYETPPEPIEEPQHGPGYCYHCGTYCFGDCGHYAPEPTRETMRREMAQATREANYGINEGA